MVRAVPDGATRDLSVVDFVKVLNVASPTRPKENPRTSRVKRVIIDSAIELLLAEGAGEVTATRISSETGVARTTIYRQWPDRPALLLAAIEALVAPHRASPPTGELAHDLVTALAELEKRIVAQQVRPVFAALADQAMQDESFVAAQRSFTAGLLTPTRNALEHAQRSGQLSKDVDCHTASLRLAGPLLYQYIALREDVTEALIEPVVTDFVNRYGHRSPR